VPIFKNTVKTVLTVPYRITVHRTVHRTATALIAICRHLQQKTKKAKNGGAPNIPVIAD
jgi:hypothetical protein